MVMLRPGHLDWILLVQVSLTFAVAVVTSPEQEGELAIHLADFSHNAQESRMADLIDHILRTFLQPGPGHQFITRACIDLRAALMQFDNGTLVDQTAAESQVPTMITV